MARLAALLATVVVAAACVDAGRVDQLEAKVAKLEEENALLEERIALLESELGAPTASGKVSAGSGYGLLRLTADPAAQVMLDGREMGWTPIVSLKVPAGRHELELRAEGCAPVKHALVVEKGRTRVLKLNACP